MIISSYIPPLKDPSLIPRMRKRRREQSEEERRRKEGITGKHNRYITKIPTSIKQANKTLSFPGLTLKSINEGSGALESDLKTVLNTQAN